MAVKDTDEVKKQAAALPLDPGVYRFLDASGTVIYVGKAKSLRRRVSSYFVDAAGHAAKVRVMVRHIRRIEYTVVPTEADALLLENNMIKNLRPRYNILLKDDKTYPWIVVKGEPFPRVESTRRMVRDGSRYFGPYASGIMQKQMLEMVHGVFQIRTCALNLAPAAIARGKYSVCLQYHIGNCKAPCVGKQSQQDYDQAVDMVVRALKGDIRPAAEHLRAQMRAAADALDFEQAARYKTRLERLQNHHNRSVVVSNRLTDLDVFSLVSDPDTATAFVNMTRIADGAVVNSFTAEFSLGADDDPTAILTRAITQITENLSDGLAREVVVPFMPEEKLFPGTTFTVPKRGEKLELLEFSAKGARLAKIEKLKNIEARNPERRTDRIMETMKRELRLKHEPRHIECFDNSNLQGTNAVASCVVFRDGKPSKKEYRHFNIKTVVGIDDFASMREILTRRYSRLLEEGADLPDLVVVDGGKGQLSAAYGVFKTLGLLDRIELIGLAKRLEEVFYPGDSMPYYMEKGGETLRVMVQLRDEAHRFGITFHRQKRSKAAIRSRLEEIPGIGPGSIQKLLKTFRTVSAIRVADEPALTAVVGASRAAAIKTFFGGEKN
ncbi:MAG: excinuclease ABC subunit UvrC [Rikenellaceae bacterium]|jgi:excinuclease ABC subunit C|nr:excinuclease ABC subunit UvrC [Rikenellaceae bacterium]